MEPSYVIQIERQYINIRVWNDQGVEIFVPFPWRRTEKREKRREAKAQVAARLDRAIEDELLKRLQSGTYGDIYNFPLKQYTKVLDQQEVEEEEEEVAAEDVEFIEGDEGEAEDEEDQVG